MADHVSVCFFLCVKMYSYVFRPNLLRGGHHQRNGDDGVLQQVIVDRPVWYTMNGAWGLNKISTHPDGVALQRKILACMRVT